MSNAVFNKPTKKLSGQVRIPPSKSAAHRAILSAMLARGISTIFNVAENEDITATIHAAEMLGAKVDYDAETRILEMDSTNVGKNERSVEIDCNESGSLLRFIIPIIAALGNIATLSGQGRLPERPLTTYRNVLPRHGIIFQTKNGGLPCAVKGRLTPGKFMIPGDISSQFITGLLFALPILNGDSEIILTSRLESEDYITLTIDILKHYGIEIRTSPSGWYIRGKQSYNAVNYSVEGDWSHAVFFLSIAALSNCDKPIEILGLKQDSLQGDKAALGIFKDFGIEVGFQNDILIASNPRFKEPFSGLKGLEINASQVPDLVPSLAICAAFCKGETVIYNASRLRFKESDRLAAMYSAIRTLGGNIVTKSDGLVIQGVKSFNAGTVKGENDHRIIMAMAAAATKSEAPFTVTDAMSVNKTYPNFYADYRLLGGNVDVVDMG